MALDEQQALRDTTISDGDFLPELLRTGATENLEERAPGALDEGAQALGESSERVSVSSGAADQ